MIFFKKFKYILFISPHLYTNRKALLAKKVPKIKQLRLVQKKYFFNPYIYMDMFLKIIKDFTFSSLVDTKKLLPLYY